MKTADTTKPTDRSAIVREIERLQRKLERNEAQRMGQWLVVFAQYSAPQAGKAIPANSAVK